MPGGRPPVTDLTPTQRAEVRAMLERDRRIQKALSTPQARAGSRFASFADTASQALLELRTLAHKGDSLLVEAAELPVCLFLSATGNAERSWEMEYLPVPAAAARRLAQYRQEFRSLVDACRFLPR